MNKKIIFFILFLIIIASFVFYWIYRESNFSMEILKVEILGPDSAKMGDEIEYTIKYKNNGNFVLEKPRLSFSMPDNSLSEDGKTNIIQDLKDIYPGVEDTIKIKTRLLGKEGDLKTAKAILSYTPKNLTVKYESETSFVTKIDTVPITLDFDIPSNVEKGKDLQFNINYFSNVDFPLENLSLKFYQVPGFDLKSANPSSLDNSEWKLQTLNKAQGGRITIKGGVGGDADQSINFSADLGMWQNGNFIVIKQVQKEVRIIQPLLFISQQVNNSSNYVASPGEKLHYQIFFRNIGNTPFENLFIVARVDSTALDLSSLKTDDGQVQPNDNMIVWDWKQTPQLKLLDVQQEASVSFDVAVKKDWDNSKSKDGVVISDEVNISQISQKFSIKVNSGLVISQAAHFKNSDIQNSGPIPPKTGKATTYTIDWNIQNYFSDAKNVKVKAILPKNATPTGKFSPTDESKNFSFDSASREIVWSVGDVLAGTGVGGDPISLSFQVSLTPSSEQKGSAAQLIGQATISGENQFTGTIISSVDKDISTALPDDFSNSGGGVVQ